MNREQELYFEYYLTNEHGEAMTIRHFESGRVQLVMDFAKPMSTEELKKFCEACNFDLIPQCDCVEEEEKKPRLLRIIK